MLTAASLVFLMALSRMPLAEAASIAFMAPLIVAVLAGPLLRERVDARTWVALAAGFGGVLLIIRPGGALFTWAALLPLASAALMAAYQLLTARLAGRDGTFTTLFYPALFALPREPLHGAMFVALGALGGIGHFFLIRAHDYASASVLSPFIYQLAAVLALGWFVFGHFPDGPALAGILTIAASGIALALGHRARARS